jgi:hypothetical protein
MPLTSSWRIFWVESAKFDFFAIFGEVNSHYSYFGGVLLGKRRRSQLLRYLGLEETILDEFLVDFGSLRPSEAIGTGFRAI